jgi:hypothetical protein
VIAKSLLVTVAIVEVVVLLFLGSPLEDRIEQETQPSASPTLASVPGHNDVGEFDFRYPRGWQVEHKGPTTRVFNRPHDAIVALGPAPEGDVLDLGDDVVASLEGSYSRVRVLDRDVATGGSGIRMTLTGRATNKDQVELRFLVVLIEGVNRNYLASAFTKSDREASAALKRVEEVAASLRCVSQEREC